MKLTYEIVVFPLISTLGLYLISNLVGAVLIRSQLLKEGDACLKVRELHHIKFQNFVFVLSNNKNETENLNVNKPKKNENIKISTISIIPYKFKWILLLLENGNFLISTAVAGVALAWGGCLLQCEYLEERRLLKGCVYLRSWAYSKKCDKLI